MAIFQTKDELQNAVNEWCNGNTKKLIEKYGHISDWKTELITDMSSLFRNKYNFNEPLYWDTSKVINMSCMFSNAKSFNQKLCFDTSNVIDMSGMFYGAFSFNQELLFDTSNVITMSYMFTSASSFNQELLFDTSNVTKMRFMFTHVYNIETLKFLLDNRIYIQFSKNIKPIIFHEIYVYLQNKNKLTDEIKDKYDKIIEKIIKIQNWWKWDIYYHPHTTVGKRRLEREYDMLYS
jgi:hypothetical protein